jgi:hypothetical protein
MLQAREQYNHAMTSPVAGVVLAVTVGIILGVLVGAVMMFVIFIVKKTYAARAEVFYF